MSNLYCGDCLDVLKNIPDDSIDLIVTDPPYNIKKAKWDNIPHYIEWCGLWIKECERVLKSNGSFYFWHNDMIQIAQLMEWIRLNSLFVFNSFCVWDKGDFRAIAWKNPSDKNNLRSWFNTCEYCLSYNLCDGVRTAWDKTGLEQILPACFEPYLDYMTSEKNALGMNIKSVNDLTGYASIASHWFWQEPQRRQPQPRFIAEQAYKKLQSTGRWKKPYEDLRREYEDLRREYEDLRYTHNLDANHNNVWHSSEHNDGSVHACKKPTDLLRRIVITSSREGATVLDCFMGSGSTGVACAETNRKFIGIEKDPKTFNAAAQRIDAAEAQIRLCGI
jgi:DNA modification methylase